MEKKNIIAIEIGSSKVKGAVGTVDEATGVIEILSVEEEQMLNWVRYGAVSNVEELSKLIKRIIRKIENRISPQKVTKVYVSIGGRSLSSSEKSTERRLVNDVEITDDIINSMAREVAVSPTPDRDLLAVEPREYVVNRRVVEQLKGSVGSHVKMTANLITCRQSTKRNLDLLFNDKLHLKVAGYKVRQLALADIVLTNQEKSLGCMLVDFGAETTTVSIYRTGKLCYMATLPMGSRNITRDLMALNYLEEHAEQQKRAVGNALGCASNGITPANPEVVNINNYVTQRAGEIIFNIKNQLKLANIPSTDLPGGIIIVGRGALLAGFNERLHDVTGMKVRVGSVNADGLLRIADARISPADASDVIAMLVKAARNNPEECLEQPEPEPVIVIEPEPEIEEKNDTQDPEPDNKSKTKQKNPRRGLLSRLKSQITKIGMEAEDDEDLRDDE